MSARIQANLLRGLQEGELRADLCCRLNVVGLRLAPRRERAEAYPDRVTKPQEMEMIEAALIRFSGDKSKAGRQVGWTPDLPEKTPKL